MVSDDDLVPLSGLQHLLYCERRAALVHTECLWAENRWTATGRLVHQRADRLGTTRRPDVRTARGLLLRCEQLGLSGKADVVEFYRLAGPGADGARLPGVAGRWRAFPVEYKRGRRRAESGYLVQLCAQAICLEEMLGAPVPEGALFFAKSQHRLAVSFDAVLRDQTEQAARRLHALLATGRTPPPVPGPKCKRCSLVDLCLPATARRRSAVAYLEAALREEEP